MDNIDWTGFRLGAGLGYGMLNQNSYVTDNTVPVTAKETAGAQGWLGRVSAGYNFQFPNCLVLGLLADYDFMNVRGYQDFPGLVGTEKQKNAWYAGALAGLRVTPHTLAFIDGGYTQTRLSAVDYNLAISLGGPTGLQLASHTYKGGFFGLGMETLVGSFYACDLFLRTEYRYSKYDTANLEFNGSIAGIGVSDEIGLRSRLSTQTAVVSLNLAI